MSAQRHPEWVHVSTLQFGKKVSTVEDRTSKKSKNKEIDTWIKGHINSIFMLTNVIMIVNESFT